MLRLSILICYLLLISACNKGGDRASWEEMDNIRQYQIYDFQIDKSTGNIVGIGGQPWNIGTIHISDDLGETWQIDSISEYSLNALQQLENEEWVAVGLYGTVVLLTPDFSVKEVIRNTFFNLTDVSCNEHYILIVGYGDFQEGTVHLYNSDFILLKDTLINQGMYASHSNDKHHYIGGYGIALSSTESDARFELVNGIQGDQILDIFQDNNENIYLLGYGGLLFKKERNSPQWQTYKITKNTIRNPGFRRGLSIPTSGKIVIVGDRGNIYTSIDNGKSWGKRQAPNEDFISIIHVSPYLILGTKSGKIFRINEDEI